MFVTVARAQTHEPAAAPAHGSAPDTGAVAHGELVAIEGEHATGVFPPMDTNYFPSQLLWLAISFGVFYIVLQRIILPRIGAIIENRRDKIALDLNAAEKMKTDADAALASYEQELASARDRSNKIALSARDSAKADADAERAKVEASLDEKLESAQARIAEIKTKALADVGVIAEDATETILKAVAGLDVSRDDVAGAVRSVRS
ncbi:MAG: F0F1 ATP synthase subunit B [Rhizobiaceae bacterium]|nr:F0F1 ATP synthase subunit B [Rhizobiaceae bacterium]